MAVITGLTPFTNYTVYVEGVTIEIGDRSEDVTVVTLMDGERERERLGGVVVCVGWMLGRRKVREG